MDVLEPTDSIAMNCEVQSPPSKKEKIRLMRKRLKEVKER
jgi:hypothetical protein